MSDLIDVLANSTSGTAKQRRQPRGAVTREKILLESAKVFDASGYSAASFSTIIAAGDFTKGSMFYHFPSKEAIAQHLVQGWSLAVAAAFSDAHATGESATGQLRNVFVDLARKVDSDLLLCAGMKLNFEPSVEGAHQVYRQWVDATSNVVDEGIAGGSISDTAHGHRLAWNLCAGFAGAANAVAVLREDLDLPTRVDDLVTAHLSLVVVR